MATSHVRTYGHPHMIPTRKWDEYKDRFSTLFDLDRTDDGIVTAKFKGPDDKSPYWDLTLHRALYQLYGDLGQDEENEVIIIGGKGKNYIGDMHIGVDESNMKNRQWMTYDHMYMDGDNMCEDLVFNLECPTIGVINGPGWHDEITLFCDIVLMADDAAFFDAHMQELNQLPGDGIQLALKECMGRKRANYAMLFGEVLDAQRCLELGLVNEVVPKDQIYDRAMELAQQIMHVPRTIRRAMVEVMRHDLKVTMANELRLTFGHEMWTWLACDEASHDPEALDKKLKSIGFESENESKRPWYYEEKGEGEGQEE